MCVRRASLPWRRACAACQSRPPAEPATLIVHNAQVYTVNTAQPTAEAVAARGDRIVLVGIEPGGAGAPRRPATRVIDARGATVVPGLQDAHGHFTGLGASLQVLRLRGTTSYEQIVEMVRARAAAARPGEWIQGRSWDQNDWPVKDWPTHDALTAAAPNNPVYLTRVDGHAALVNKAALDAAGITRATPDPTGGRADPRRRRRRRPACSSTAHRSSVASKIPPVSGRAARGADPARRRRSPQAGADHGARRRRRPDDRRGLQAPHRRRQAEDAALRDAARPDVDARAGVRARARSSTTAAIACRCGRSRSAPTARSARAARRCSSRTATKPGTSGFLTTPEAEIYAQTLAASRAGFQTCDPRHRRSRQPRHARRLRARAARSAGRARSAHAHRARADPRRRRHPALRPAQHHRLDAGDARHVGHAVGAGADRAGAHRRGRVRLAAADEVRRGARQRLRLPGRGAEPDARLATRRSLARIRRASQPADGCPRSGCRATRC